VDFQVRITQKALADLEEIFEYSWERFPSSTERFGSELLDHIYMLQRFPLLGRPIGLRSNVRELVHTPVTIVYRVQRNPNLIVVLRVQDARRGRHPYD